LRSLVYRFDDLFSFGRALGAADQELPLPDGEAVADGEWVLAIFEVGERRRATAAAARGMDKGDGTLALMFERRDWERLQTFSEAKSEKLRAARPVTAAYESIPITVDPASEPEHTQISAGSVSPRAQQQGSPTLGGVGSSPRPAPRSSSSMPVTSPSGRFTTAPSARVLLVDDDADIRDVVGAMLEAVGLIVEPVTSAEDALERVRETHFDLLVLDWNLPGMTGLELCRQVRREPQFASMPVLFLTAHSSSKDIVEAFASGADDYVSKPFRAPELGARIFGLLRRSRVSHS
jgi:two-component system phosphate regulon response regulator PhoB